MMRISPGCCTIRNLKARKEDGKWVARGESWYGGRVSIPNWEFVNHHETLGELLRDLETLFHPGSAYRIEPRKGTN